MSDAHGSSPLFAAVRTGELETVRRILAAGANPNLGNASETPLHAAARRGDLAIVEALIAGGALEWLPDAKGNLPLEIARHTSSAQRAAIVALLDRTAISDASFRAAVDAVHAGDVTTLGCLIDAEPRLLRERMLGPQAYRLAARHQYFRDPKLFWYIANNPKTVDHMPTNVVDVMRVMTDRGVEKVDLDYALELAMTSSVAREQGHQLPLVRALIASGAELTREAVIAAAAYGERNILQTLIADGFPQDALLAAALSANEKLPELLATCDADEIQIAFALAVMNRNVEGARAALDAGADINAFLPVHTHSTALHQAAVNDDAPLVKMLLARGALINVHDKLWDGTPLDWALHELKPTAAAVLQQAMPP